MRSPTREIDEKVRPSASQGPVVTQGTSTRYPDSTSIKTIREQVVSSNRTNLRRIVFGVAVVFAVIVLVDALDLFDSKSWTEISHGNHSHFIPYDKDEDVSVSSCPQHPPADNEMLSSQCQLLTLVQVGETTRYIPNDRNPNVPDDQFPTRPPGSGVIITPNGELAAAGAH